MSVTENAYHVLGTIFIHDKIRTIHLDLPVTNNQIFV